MDKTLRLVRISLLISAIQRVLRFFSGKLFYKSNRKLFSCVCKNSRQLCKPSTSSRVCITVSHSPNPSSVYIRLCKQGKRFLVLKYIYIYIYCLFEGTGKTVTGVHMAYWFTKRNLQLLSQEDRSYADPEPPKAPPQVIYCGPSNKSVDVVARKCKLE